MTKNYWEVTRFDTHINKYKSDLKDILYGDPYESKQFDTREDAESFLKSINNCGCLHQVLEII
jgi:hypothetical protein